MNEALNIIVLATADGATAQLRRVAPLADKDAARRISAELKRIAAGLDRKHGFREQIQPKVAELALK